MITFGSIFHIHQVCIIFVCIWNVEHEMKSWSKIHHYLVNKYIDCIYRKEKQTVHVNNHLSLDFVWSMSPNDVHNVKFLIIQCTRRKNWRWAALSFVVNREEWKFNYTIISILIYVEFFYYEALVFIFVQHLW